MLAIGFGLVWVGGVGVWSLGCLSIWVGYYCLVDLSGCFNWLTWVVGYFVVCCFYVFGVICCGL